jgi:hypothetical protein
MRKAFAIAGFVFLALAASQVVSASPITLAVGAGGTTGDHILGEVFTTNDIQGGLLVRDEAAIDVLRLMALDTRTGTAPQYYRSATSFGTLPDAVQTGAAHAGSIGDMTTSGTGILITLNDTYMYLVGSYDGPHGGTEVWYIGDIAAGTTIEIPRNAEPVGNPRNLIESSRYQITTWTAFNPVPDGGATAVLLGLAMLGLGFARRRLKG